VFRALCTVMNGLSIPTVGLKFDPSLFPLILDSQKPLGRLGLETVFTHTRCRAEELMLAMHRMRQPIMAGRETTETEALGVQTPRMDLRPHHPQHSNRERRKANPDSKGEDRPHRATRACPYQRDSWLISPPRIAARCATTT